MIDDMEPTWLAWTERRMNWLAVPGLAMFLAVMNGVVGLMTMIKPEFPAALALDPAALARGEVWRVLTFLLVPPPSPILWLLLWLVVFYSFTSRLEVAWGDFRFTAYCLLGALGLTAAALLTGRYVGNSLFQTSLFLAFARLHPDFEIFLFFVFPARMKWLSVAAWALLAFQFLVADGGGKLLLLLGVLNYALFFGPRHWSDARYALRRRFSR